MQCNEKNDRSGFTLVELLVVIAIIGVLATIAFVAFQSNVGTADDTKKISDLNVITKAMGIYYVNNQEYPPSASPTKAFNCERGDETGGLKDSIEQYIDGRADLDWRNIIYGRDTEGEVYILGHQGIQAGSVYVKDEAGDLDLGDTLNNGAYQMAIPMTFNAPSSSNNFVCLCDAQRLPDGGGDTVYCETNRP